MVESTGSSGIPPKKIPASTQQNASTNANANANVNNQRPATKKDAAKEKADAKGKDPSIVGKEADQGIKALVAGQVSTAQRNAALRGIIDQAIKQDPKKALSDSTFSGLVNAAKNFNKTGGRFDPSEPNFDEDLEGLTPDLEAALRLAFSGQA